METDSGTPSRPALSRICSQHVVLHRAVNALEAWLAKQAEGQPASESPERLLRDIYRILPEHFALEEQGGYFSDLLSVAPDLAERATELQAHHQLLIPQLERLLSCFADAPGGARPDPEDRLGLVRQFVDSLRAHEEGEDALMRAAARSSSFARGH